MEKHRIVLVQPPVEDFYLTSKRTIPYGLASIAAGLFRDGYDVQIIDGLATDKKKRIQKPASFAYLDEFYSQKDLSLFSLFNHFFHFGYSYQHIAFLTKQKAPFLVGISSLFTAYANQVFKVAQAIKKSHPACSIVVGGHHPTQFPENMLENPSIDFVIRGEAELAMPELARALLADKNLQTVPGIAFKKNHRFFVSEPAWINNLGDLPIPRFDLINQKFYTRKKRKAAVVVSSRGCPMPCTYCSVSSSSCYAKYRLRPVEDVVKEIKTQLQSDNVGFIDFEDENLCLKKDWFIALFKALTPLLKKKNIELRAMNGLYPGSLDEENIQILKQAGFKTLNLSLGSTSKKQLEKFQRPDIRMAFKNALNLARQYNLEAVSYLIAAAPGQFAASSLADLLDLAQKRTLIGLSIYYPAPGSLDFRHCEANNLLADDFSLFRSSALPVEDTTSRLQAVTLLRLCRIINFIKHLLDTYGHLNLSEMNSNEILVLTDREKISVQLLRSSFKKGVIAGISPDHQIFTHKCDENLVQDFFKQIKELEFRGVKTTAKAKIML